jgi:diguanylate cyclase (GGDEF)-like protein
MASSFEDNGWGALKKASGRRSIPGDFEHVMMIPAIAKIGSFLRSHPQVSSWVMALTWSAVIAAFLAGQLGFHGNVQQPFEDGQAASYPVVAGLGVLVWGLGIGGIVWGRRQLDFHAERAVRAEARPCHLSCRDPVANLPDRSLFLDQLARSVVRSHLNERRTAVLYIGLDGFSAINDAFGQESGAWVLREVTSRLATVIRQTDTVARVGDDEFVIILGDLPGSHVAARVANDIIEIISLPISLDETAEVAVDASMGIAFFPDDADTPEALLRVAAAAMQEVKKVGANGFNFAGGDAKTAVSRRALPNKKRASLHG